MQTLMGRNLITVAAAFVLTLFLGWACQSQAQPRLRVQLHWQHQAQFAGFYVAQARRHFEREGLVVELVEGGPGIDPFARLKKGEVDVAVGWLGTAAKVPAELAGSYSNLTSSMLVSSGLWSFSLYFELL